MQFFIQAICLVFFVTACSPSREYEVYDLEPVSGVDHFVDSIYFNKIYNIEWSNGSYYASDGSSIYIFNEEFDLENYWGAVGKGPKEYQNNRSFKVYQSNIHVFDNSNRNVKTYTRSGEHLNNRKVIGIDVPIVVQEFDFYQEYMYMAGANLMRFDILDNESNEVLKELEYEGFLSVFITNNGENIILANHGSGVIQKLNFNGDVIAEVNLRLTELGQELLLHVDPSKPGVFMFLWDIHLVGNNLYMLLAGYNEDNQRECNQIMRLDLSNNLLDYLAFKLPERRYTSFAVGNNSEHIIAYSDVDGGLKKFYLSID